MPELPEVETGRAFAEKHLLKDRIEGLAVHTDPIVFPNASPAKLSRALKGRRVERIRRRGKHLWFELDRRPWPTFHFGMTGRFEAYEQANERPRFWKIELRMASGLRFAMINKRRLGRIRLLQDPENEAPIASLGFDPLLDPPSPARFAELSGKRAAPAKAVLLDQAFAAGVGNWVADEILFQARIDPRRRMNELTRQELTRMRTAMIRIIRKAVAVEADASRFPKSWLFHHRWGKNTDARTAAGEAIEFMTVGGRTTAWVPSRQSGGR